MRQILIPLQAQPTLPAVGSVELALAGTTMGSSWSVKLMVAEHQLAGLQPNLQQGLQQNLQQHLRQLLQNQLDTIEMQMSHWQAASNLSRFNYAAPGSWHLLPPPMAQVLACALQVRSLSGGAYDPCAGALVNLWGFGAQGRFDQPGFVPPPAGALAASLRQVRQHYSAGQPWADPAQQCWQQPGGLLLDLSSIAKGFAVDQLAACLQAQGMQHFLVEVGGELRGAGLKADGQPWWVLLETPPDLPLPQQTLVALHGLAVASSGDYRQHYQLGTRRISHTLDPRSGQPLANQVALVTVVHPECMQADAWASAMMVLGPEAGLALAERLGLAVRFLLRQNGQAQALHSSPWQAMLQ